MSKAKQLKKLTKQRDAVDRQINEILAIGKWAGDLALSMIEDSIVDTRAPGYAPPTS